jgi:Gluconate 2-dehydrogenase subunit 3
MSDKTRRDWLITISSATATALAESLTGGSGPATALPPGVYDPSTDHLGHALMSAERYYSIPSECPTEYVSPRNGPFAPKFFSKTELPVVRSLVQVLLGGNSDELESVEETIEWIDLRVSEAGDVRKAVLQLSPLHRAVAVAHYGPLRVDQMTTDDPVKVCQEGLAWIGSHSKDFQLLTFQEQTDVVRTMGEDKVDNPGGRFFAFLKSETIKGFYTSRAGLKELDYKGNAFYARSPGCSTQTK